jgi:hypothetical protein
VTGQQDEPTGDGAPAGRVQGAGPDEDAGPAQDDAPLREGPVHEAPIHEAPVQDSGAVQDTPGVRGQSANWPDRPAGGGCLLAFAILMLIAIVTAYGIVLLIQTLS